MSDAALLEPGSVVAGKYRLERLIGAGGMGRIWCAFNELLETRVALKIMAAEARTDENALSRFLREGRAAARLRSEHIARVLDCGTLDDGSFYLVSELLEGQDLAHVVRGAPLPIATAVDYMVQACNGVAEAHANGIVHRDIKPANLFLTETVSGRPLVKVLDFGICKIQEAGSQPLVTRHDEILGTPRYMAPEQVLAQTVDARTDIWALGVVLFELLTKRRPFDHEDMGATLMAILEGDPPRPDALRPEIDAALAEIVLRCLAKAPADRFADVASLANALAPFGNGRRPSTPLRVYRPHAEETPLARVEVSSRERAIDVGARGSAEREPVRVGPYLMFGPLGRGGMAVVHYGCARIADGDFELVALKRLRADISDSNALKMFADEARLAEAIRHPNVVATRDVVANGNTTLVLEYVPGVSLAEVLEACRARETTMPVPIAVAIATDALRGLAAAHDAHDATGAPLEIVHRDVSPQNVLVSESGLTKLTDFGIAMARRRMQRTTETGALKGKLGYLAPEQIHGKASRASDLYALGAVLWEMLVGEPLHSGSDGEVLAAALVGRIDAPSKRGAATSAALDDVVLKALARDAEHRPANANVMIAELTGVVTPATHADVAAWLATVVGDELDVRRETARAVRDAARAFSDAPQHDHATTTTIVMPDATAARSRRRRIVAALAIVAAMMGGFAIANATRRAATPVDAPPPPASALPVASAPTEPPPLAVPNDIDTTPSATPSALAADAGPPNEGKNKRKDLGKTRPKVDCSVPYHIDANGQTIWRRECFKR